MADENIKEAALEFHRRAPAGKLGIVATKPLATQRDMSLAYSPGVAAACESIAEESGTVAELTARGNLIGVISNGTAVLGLGSIGALASKPVMEGKAVLFKKFAGIDVFDIEVDETDVDRFVDVVAALEPTFGGINLEDIKAPECFEIEKRLRQRMNIPVFHDDQHGTAIIVAAAVTNGLEVVGKKIDQVKLVCSGAGAAALACLNLLVALGLKRENIFVCDIAGLVYEGRTEEMDPYKAAFAQATDARTMGDVIGDADVFMGLSAPGVLKPDMVARMADKPIILALANPVPEIMPEDAKAARPDAIIATGRSDYPNQVNNVLCFPFIFRGALDVGATEINEAMKIAAVQAIAELARMEVSEAVAAAYGGETHAGFGPDYIIPRPFDLRLILRIAPAVARAAMDSGVATRPIEDFDAYDQRLHEFVYRSGLVMKPIMDAARQDPQRVVFAEGESRRVLHAVQVVLDEGIARPILVGRREVIGLRIKQLGLRIDPDSEVEIVDPEDDPRYREYWTMYHELLGRKGVSPDLARTVVRTQNTVIAALMLRRGEADAMICGAQGNSKVNEQHVRDVIGMQEGVRDLSTLIMLILSQGTVFVADTHVTFVPSPEELAEMAAMAATEVQRFGIEPRIALLSHANFGSSETNSSRRMREAVAIMHRDFPELEVDGEMHADAALDDEIRERILPGSKLTRPANLLIMPTVDAAHIAYNLLKVLGDGLTVGPMMLGLKQPAHVLTASVTARGIVNMTAVACVEAQMMEQAG